MFIRLAKNELIFPATLKRSFAFCLDRGLTGEVNNCKNLSISFAGKKSWNVKLTILCFGKFLSAIIKSAVAAYLKDDPRYFKLFNALNYYLCTSYLLIAQFG